MPLIAGLKWTWDAIISVSTSIFSGFQTIGFETAKFGQVQTWDFSGFIMQEF